MTQLEEPVSAPAPTSAESASSEQPTENQRRGRRGLAYALAAMATWGILPFYFKALQRIPPFELLVHRVVWSAALLALIATFTAAWGPVRDALRNRRTVVTLSISTLLIAGNWFGFIQSVVSKQLLQASLGYFLSPLLIVLFGRLFFGERQSRLRIICVAIAAAGVAILTWQVGAVPWLALGLAGSFATYAMIRKSAPVDAFSGLLIETSLLAPLGVCWLVQAWLRGASVFGHDSLQVNAALLLAGALTALPLLWYTKGARLLKLSTIGFLQYISPCLQFLIAVIAFKEPFGSERALSFGLIWIALALFTVGEIWQARQSRVTSEHA